LPSRFRFKGNAYAAAGVLTTPFQEIIEVQAPSTLSEIGGYAAARVPAFSHRNVLRFDSAHTEVSGSRTHGGKSYSSLVKAHLKGLDIMGMITADLVVANLIATYTPEEHDEISIKLIGSRFENLKIAGHPIEVEMSVGTIDKHHRHSYLKDAWKNSSDVRNLFGDETLREWLASKAPAQAKDLIETPPDPKSRELPNSDTVSTLSIVKSLRHPGAAFESFGNVIHIEGFGTICLGEVRVSKNSRQLTMIRVRFGCPVEGDGSAGCVEGGGTKGN
jgi:hypothetical protein